MNGCQSSTESYSERQYNLQRISDFHAVLLGMAAHDLRQPLQVIQSTYEWLSGRFDGDVERMRLQRGERERLTRAPLVIAVVSRAAPHVKIPEWEQVLSAGAAAMNLVTAAHALGYGANWITEWYAYDRGVLDALGLAQHERIAGFIHIGRPPGPPEDRPRPPLNEIAVRFTA